MLAMTRTGMCWAYSSAASTDVRSPIAVDQLVAVGAGRRLELVDRLGREDGQQEPAGAAWNGGSEEIGGAMPAGASSSGGRNGVTTTLREVNRSVS